MLRGGCYYKLSKYAYRNLSYFEDRRSRKSPSPTCKKIPLQRGMLLSKILLPPSIYLGVKSTSAQRNDLFWSPTFLLLYAVGQRPSRPFRILLACPLQGSLNLCELWSSLIKSRWPRTLGGGENSVFSLLTPGLVTLSPVPMVACHNILRKTNFWKKLQLFMRGGGGGGGGLIQKLVPPSKSLCFYNKNPTLRVECKIIFFNLEGTFTSF